MKRPYEKPAIIKTCSVLALVLMLLDLILPRRKAAS